MKTKSKTFYTYTIPIIMMLACLPIQAYAVTMHEELNGMLNQHPKLQSAISVERSTEWDVESATDNYLPTFSIFGETGRDSYEDPNTTFGEKSRLTKSKVNYELKQNLFRGFSDEATVSGSRAENKIANYQTSKTAQDLLLEGVNVYVAALRVKELGDVINNKVVVARQLLSIKKRAKKSGSATDIDVLEASLAIQKALDEELVSIAEVRAVSVQYEKLFKRNSLPDNMSSVDIPERLLPQNIDTAIQAVVATNPDVAMARLQMDVAKSEQKNAASEYYPSLDLVGLRYYDRNREGREGAIFENALLLRLNWEFNLGNKVGANVSSASEKLRSAQFDYDNTLQEISQNVGLAYERFKNMDARQKLARETLGISKRVLQSRKEQRRSGKVDDSVVIGARARVLSAQHTAITTYYDAVRAAYELAYLTGELTPTNMGIKLSQVP